MITVSFDTIVGYEGMTFLPFTRYVITEASFNVIARTMAKDQSRILANSCFNSRQRTTRKHVDNRLVAVYRHTAYGDQLVMTGVTAYMRYIWPDARIFYFCSPEVTDIWRWNPHVEFCGGPMPLEMLDAMHDHFFFERMFECDSEPDQYNCYDAHFRACGFDPADVPDEFKRPYIFFNEKEKRVARKLKGDLGDYIVYHWSSSNPNRMYPAENSVATLQLLSDEFPDHKVVVVGTATEEDIKDTELEMPRVIDMRNQTKNFREVMLYVKESVLVIGPDSSIMHIAGGLSKPCISLWGLFHPDDRVKYYLNSHPITGFNACPHAPCRNHDFHLPARLCRDAFNHVEPPEFCNALRSIAPLQIITKTHQILNDTRRSPEIPADKSDPSITVAGQVEVPSDNAAEVGEDHLVQRNSRRAAPSV